MELKYEDLVKDHWERLNSKLRMFSADAGPEFLDTWVPDEDPDRSLFGIFEAAANAGVADLTVLIKPETAKALNEAWLKEKLGILGQAGFSKRGQDTVVALKFSKTKAGLKSLLESKIKAKKVPEKPKISAAQMNGLVKIPFVHEAHKAGIEKALKNIRHEGKVPVPGADETLLAANAAGVSLSVILDKRGTATAAAHHGAKEKAHRAILDELCHWLLNRPIQEGRDHGIIRVEYAFRDPGIKWPVQGLVTAENTSSAFKLPQDLIREIFKDYINRFHVKVEWNFWDDPASETWTNASKEQKIEKAQEVLKHAAQELGANPAAVEVADITADVRIMIGYNPSTIKLDFASKMIKMEKILKEHLDPRLELHLENLDDRNKRDSRTGRLSGPEIPQNQ